MAPRVAKRYPGEIIDGLPCKHGHGTRRYARFGGCVECVRLENARPRARARRVDSNRNWCKVNREYANARRCDYNEQHPEATMLNACRNVAKAKGLLFDLVLDDISIPERCPILDIPLIRRQGKRNDNSPSIDRIVPCRGYVRGNIVVISWRANRLKSDASIRELKLIAAFYASKN